MNNEEQFKNKVKKLVDEKQFPYKPENWEHISDALDKQARKKKLIYLIIIAGVFISVVSLLFIEADKSAPVTLQTLNPVESKNKLKKKNEERINSINTEKNSISTENKTATSKTLNYTNNAAKSLSKSEYNVEKNKQNTIHSSTITSISKTLIQTLPEKLASTSNVENEELKSIENHNIGIKSDSAENISNRDKSLNNIQTTGFIKMETKIENDLEPNVLQSQVYQSNSLNTFLNQQQKEDTATTLNLNRINKYLTFNDTNTSILSLQAQKADSLNTLILNDEPIKKTQSGLFILEVGSFFNTGWKYNAKQEALGFNIYSGIGYSRKLTPKLNLFIGTYYAPVSHLKASKKIVTDYDFVFGERIEITEISPLTLNYVQVPLSLQYLLTSNHALSFGYAFNYLLDVRSKVEKYTEELHTTFDKQSFKTFGYTDGFAKLNSSLLFGYRFKISKNLWINNQLIFGLTELRQDDFLKNEHKEKSRGIIVSLNYYLLKK